MEGRELVVRQVGREDVRLLWEWANEPDVRAASFSSAPIPWDDHVRWFERRLDDPRCALYIASNGEGRPVGQIRFEREGDEAVVSISLAPEARGKGFGTELIQLGGDAIFAAWRVDRIHAYVKSGNEASARAFAKAGFREVEPFEVRGQPARHFL